MTMEEIIVSGIITGYIALNFYLLYLAWKQSKVKESTEKLVQQANSLIKLMENANVQLLTISNEIAKIGKTKEE